jgi:hypothetical protein
MKCVNPNCNRSIGLVSYRRAWSSKRYCSRQCRDAPKTLQRNGTSRFEWLLLPPVENPSAKVAPAVVRVRTR